jgi:hypothetical protein
MLIAVPRFDDSMIQLLWAGDLDHDGKLDLLLDGSQKYNSFTPKLFLSSPSEESEIIKYVGEHASSGC